MTLCKNEEKISLSDTSCIIDKQISESPQVLHWVEGACYASITTALTIVNH